MLDSTVFHSPFCVCLDSLADLEVGSALRPRLPGVASDTAQVEQLLESMLRWTLLVRSS